MNILILNFASFFNLISTNNIFWAFHLYFIIHNAYIFIEYSANERQYYFSYNKINFMYICYSLGFSFLVLIQITIRKVRPSKDSLSLSLGGGKLHLQQRLCSQKKQYRILQLLLCLKNICRKLL